MEKNQLVAFIDENIEKWRQISKYLFENPELGHQEFKAMKLLTHELEKEGFLVERGAADLPTAFIATYQSAIEGPTVAYLAEYDALPEIGHACGHNLIATMSLAAGFALKKAIDSIGGKLIIYGTPAEETNGAKVTMAEQGLFNGVDVAMMAHPFRVYEKSGRSMAMEALQFDFFGKASHASSNPHEGINALDAVIQLFNTINE